jgi:hypothetical protein
VGRQLQQGLLNRTRAQLSGRAPAPHRKEPIMADIERSDAIKSAEEDRITTAIEQELSDDQLLQLAEGASSWGANCNHSC